MDALHPQGGSGFYMSFGVIDEEDPFRFDRGPFDSFLKDTGIRFLKPNFIGQNPFLELGHDREC